MKKRWITDQRLQLFRKYLIESEKAEATVEKYTRDVKQFAVYAANRLPDKTLILQYKEKLGRDYTTQSANSMLAAVNAFLRFLGRPQLCVKPFRVQKEAYCSEKKELTRAEYAALLRTAEQKKNQRLVLVVQTICGTGIRVSELQHITVEAVRQGEATVFCKGKSRKIFIVKALRKKLLRYAAENGITTGLLFKTQGGKPLNRSNIWRQMKSLCARAGVPPQKVYPHNLRHLFARTFYSVEKDIAELAAKALQHIAIMGLPKMDFETRCRTYFLAIWRFILGNRDKCLTYVRYYYSPNFSKFSAIEHKKRFALLVEKFSSAFKKEADVWMILNHILNVILDFAVKVHNGQMREDDDYTEHIFRVIYKSVDQYFI